MTDHNENLNRLLNKLESLVRNQEKLSGEVDELRQEIYSLSFKSQAEQLKTKPAQPAPTVSDSKPEQAATPVYHAPIKQPPIVPKSPTSPKVKSDIEKFIGENLINKIGIAITVIGVGIGAKYSIEHELVSPLTRIILGYLMGLGLLGFGIKLKQKYTNYSAVLVSGAIAIMYFITYAAYSFYELIPQTAAFALMVVFTVFTVVAAINYNMQVIAHIGLVGAYAVPFLLSNGSGKIAVLFTYMAIINTGILIIAFKRYWKSLYYSSFILTWLIFLTWFNLSYETDKHFALALIFLTTFFATFYSILLAYKLVKKEKFGKEDILLLLSNAFIFYGLGYAIISSNSYARQLLGLFTLSNAIVHFSISVVIYRQKLADRNLFFLIAGLVLVFITLAVPVQLDGNWVTLIWAFEAALLFWIGRTKNISVYEKLAYPLMFLSFFSMVHDWLTIYDNYERSNPSTKLTPIANANFLVAVLFIAAFAFINYVNTNKKFVASPFRQKKLNAIIAFSIPAILLIVLYTTFRLEISTYWEQRYTDSEISIKMDKQGYPATYLDADLLHFKELWILNYSLFFLSALILLNSKKIKNITLGWIATGTALFVLCIFLTDGLYILKELRQSYLEQTLSEYYPRTNFNIGIRYISYVFVALLIVIIYTYVNKVLAKHTAFKLSVFSDIALHTSLIWIASSELITRMTLMGSDQSSKLGLSILWGLYALALIVIGISKKKKHLRIAAIVLFGITLIKLFLYDISHLSTIAKTVVFVSLGILLLIISFLYNKYKHFISDEEHKN